MSRSDPAVAAAIAAGRRLLGSDDVVEAEVTASTLLGYLWAEGDLAGDPVPHLVAALARKARPGGDVGAYAMLRALARVLPPDQRAVADDATASWSPRQRPDLRWVAAPEPPPVGAWLGANPYGDETTVLVEYGGPAAHTIVATVERIAGEAVTEVGILPPPSARELVADFDYPLPPVAVAAAEEALAAAVWSSDMVWPRPGGDEPYAGFRALLTARLRLWDRERTFPEYQPLPEDERRRLVDAFTALQHDAAEDDDVVRTLAETFLDYGEGYIAHPSPLHWSPRHAAVFLLDWVHRKTTLDPAEREALPDTLIDWCYFAFGQAGLDQRLAEPVGDTILDLEEEFLARCADPRAAGVAGDVVAALVADGVDVTDRAAVGAWLDAYDARIVGSAPD